MSRNVPALSGRELLTASRYRIAALAAGLWMAVGLLTRLGLLALHALGPQAAAGDGILRTLAALAAGEAFDAVAALWLIAPWMLALLLVPERWLRSRPGRAAVLAVFVLTVYGALFVAVVEHFFFAEFDGRFNFVAVDYLLYPTEVLNNIWESYPTGTVLVLIALAAIAVGLALRPLLRPARRLPAPLRQRLAVSALFAAVTALVAWTVPPSLAQVSADRPLNEIAGNGYYSFWRSLLGREASWDGLYPTRDRPQVIARLHRLLAEPTAPAASFAPDTTLRRVVRRRPERRMNVVIVLEESLGAEHVGVLGSEIPGLTPRLDALSSDGTLLVNAYSTGNRTIRAIEATTSSLPPLPGVSIVQRERSHDLFTLPALLGERGYQTLFVYGGRALFDGMGRYLTANGVQRVVDQGSFPADAFHTAWGVADQAIFDRALTEMDAMAATGRPFYTLILTVSNHRPYEFPEGTVAWDRGLDRRGNAVRYADWALGRFIRQARDHDFFADTLFVLMGDHGARVYGAAEIPLMSYRVPILFLAPGLVPAGRRVETLASSLDVPPTVLGLLGFDYDSRFFGHDVLALPAERGRALMNHNNEVALMRGGRIAVLGLHASTAVYRVEAGDRFVPEPAGEGADRDLVEDAIAYYDGADELYRDGAYRLAAPAGDDRAPVTAALPPPRNTH